MGTGIFRPNDSCTPRASPLSLTCPPLPQKLRLADFNYIILSLHYYLSYIIQLFHQRQVGISDRGNHGNISPKFSRLPPSNQERFLGLFVIRYDRQYVLSGMSSFYYLVFNSFV